MKLEGSIGVVAAYSGGGGGGRLEAAAGGGEGGTEARYECVNLQQTQQNKEAISRLFSP